MATTVKDPVTTPAADSEADARPVGKTIVSNLVIIVGSTTAISVDAVSASIPNKDKDSEFHTACNVCSTPTRLQRKMACPTGHEQAGAPAKKCKELPGPGKQLVFVTDEEIEAVRGTDNEVDDTGPKTMNVVPVRMADVMEHTLPGNTIMRLRPNPKTSAKGTYDILRLLVTQAMRSGKVLIGTIKVRTATQLFWLSIRHDQVIVQALMWPDDIAAADEIAKVDLGEKGAAMAATMIAGLTEDFDVDNYRNLTRERARQLLVAKADEGTDATITQIPTKSKSDTIDVDALVNAMLAS